MNGLQQAILPLFEQFHGDWLSAARRIALELGKGGREVTIDDVREKLPPPDGKDPRICGGVFVRRDWEVVGYRGSQRRISHRRPVAVFKRKFF